MGWKADCKAWAIPYILELFTLGREWKGKAVAVNKCNQKKKKESQEKMRCGNGADVCESAEGHWVRLGLTLGFPQQLPHYPTTLVAHMIHTTHHSHQHTQ